jgi:DNA polymerase III psi subunit
MITIHLNGSVVSQGQATITSQRIVSLIFISNYEYLVDQLLIASVMRLRTFKVSQKSVSVLKERVSCFGFSHAKAARLNDKSNFDPSGHVIKGNRVRLD